MLFLSRILLTVLGALSFVNALSLPEQLKLVSIFEKVVLDDPDALCLDGSRGAYSILKGDPKKIYLELQGWGWCGASEKYHQVLEDCYLRSFTEYGSSDKMPDRDNFFMGIFSLQKDNYFHDWTRVYLNYCDGSGHQGTRSEPIIYKGRKLYFRGNNITIAQFNALNESLGLFTDQVTDVILSGSSSGGTAVFHWANYLGERLSPQTRYKTISDSGMFLDPFHIWKKRYLYRDALKQIMSIANQQVPLPVPECNQAYSSDPWKCFFPQYLHPFVKPPLFVMQSLYDKWTMEFLQGIQCIKVRYIGDCEEEDRKLMESDRLETIAFLDGVASKEGNGVWGIGCCHHSYLMYVAVNSQRYRVPGNSEVSYMKAITDWYQEKEGSHVHIDRESWPNNRACAGGEWGFIH